MLQQPVNLQEQGGRADIVVEDLAGAEHGSL
jgi:hypothetical protein